MMSMFSPFHLFRRSLLPVLGLVIASSGAASAQLLDVANQGATGDSYTNTGNMSGGAVLASGTNGTTPDQWNLLTSNAQTLTLSDTSGDPTAVTLTTSFDGSNFTGHDSVGGFETPLFEHFLYKFSGGTASLDFANLAADTSYDLVIYNTNNNDGTDTTYTVNGTTTTLLESGHNGFYSEPATNTQDTGTIYTGNYVELQGTSDASGDLDITLGLAPSNTSNNSGTSGGEYLAFTGLQLERATVPEPTSSVLLVAGLAATVLFIRRRYLSSRV